MVFVTKDAQENTGSDIPIKVYPALSWGLTPDEYLGENPTEETQKTKAQQGTTALLAGTLIICIKRSDVKNVVANSDKNDGYVNLSCYTVCLFFVFQLGFC